MQKIWLDNECLTVGLSDFGARITDIYLKGGDAPQSNLVKGYDELDDYRQDEHYRGAIIAPLANRIPAGEIRIEEQNYSLPKNEPNACLHSGGRGTDSIDWVIRVSNPTLACFTTNLPLERIGLPGILAAKVNYSLSHKALTMELSLSSSCTNFLNPTNHVYLNLAGAGESLNHHKFDFENSRQWLVTQHRLPTGEKQSRVNSERYQLGKGFSDGSFSEGLDHYFELASTQKTNLNRLISIECTETGVGLIVASSAPGFQLYTELNDAPAGSAFCIEPQFFIGTPDPVLHRCNLISQGQTFTQTIEWRFVF